MKLTKRQKYLSNQLAFNLSFYSQKLAQLNMYADTYDSQIYAHNITELKHNVQATLRYIEELEEESYRVAEKEAGQYA